MSYLLSTLMTKMQSSAIQKLEYSSNLKAQTCAKITTFDRPQVLLVALPIACILVHHIWSARLNLAVNDSKPKFLCFDGLARASLALVLLVKLLELVTPYVLQTRRLIRTEQRPVSIRLNLD